MRPFLNKLAVRVRRVLFGEAFGLHRQDIFRAILDRERNLADRERRRFSLLVFTLADDQYQPDTVRSLCSVLSDRLRRSDIAGWMDRDRVGAILAGTDGAGARRVAEDICQKAAVNGGSPACRVYTYPSEDPAGPGARPSDAVETRQASSGIRPGRGRNGGGAMARRGGAVEMATQTEWGRLMISHEGEDSTLALLTAPYPRWKRFLDVVLALVTMVVFAPVMLLLAVYIRIVSPGPIFFSQERIGRLGRRFMCIKFRTMHVNADAAVHKNHLENLMEKDVPMRKLDEANDPRVIPLGRIIRASGFDELPQLINVLRGEMSIVGPRPCVPYEYEKYEQWHKRRHDTLPGLTGLWQVSGKNSVSFSQMMRFDVAYARGRSLWRDVSILAKTLPVILSEMRHARSLRDASREKST
jgi:lipopolysaccharide/colanic/teichoic acid biosynthesis glycosyltransferase